MRIVAVTMQREDQPVRERDVHAPRPAPRACGLVMIAPPPTNTSANVPMNSAAKWRQASFMRSGWRSRERRYRLQAR